MKLIKPVDKKWDEKEGYSKKIFLNENDLNSSGSLVQQIKIKPGETAKSHYHKKQTEIFYFLNNNGYFTVNNKIVIPQAGDILVVEPNDKHIVTNNTDQDFFYMAFKINYSGEDLYWD